MIIHIPITSNRGRDTMAGAGRISGKNNIEIDIEIDHG
jgi:hypothetical protein